MMFRLVVATLFLFCPNGLLPLKEVKADCISSNSSIEAVFAGDRVLPLPGSCCMQDVCGLACPVPVQMPAPGYGTAVSVFVVFSVLFGVCLFFFVVVFL